MSFSVISANCTKWPWKKMYVLEEIVEDKATSLPGVGLNVLHLAPKRKLSKILNP